MKTKRKKSMNSGLDKLVRAMKTVSLILKTLYSVARSRLLQKISVNN